MLALLAIVLSAGPTPAAPTEVTVKGTEVTVVSHSGSTLKLRVLDEKLKLQTKYGTLDIVVADIKTVEFATRVPAKLATLVDAAIKNLNHPDHKVREEATKFLKDCDYRASPLIHVAAKSDDPEVKRRAEEVIAHLRGRYTDQQLKPRLTDVVRVEGSTYEGTIPAEYLNVESDDFGKKEFPIQQLISLGSRSAKAEVAVVATEAPGNMSAYQQQFGKELTFAVTGFTPVPGANPSLWGTGTYTLDSNLAAAVVHAGIAKPGERIVVKVRVVASPAQFVSTFQNNVNSSAYGNYPAGGYEFVR